MGVRVPKGRWKRNSSTGGILPSQGKKKKKKEAGFPGQGKQSVLAKKRQTEREGPLLGKAEGRHFPGSRTRAYHLAPGGDEECPMGC